MTARVFIHVGPYKTGTTFIQQVLDGNQPALRRHGVCLPSGGTVPQSQAALDLFGKGLHGDRRRVRGHWRRLAEDAHAWSGDVAVVSAEILARATPRQIDRMVTSMEPAEVHVIYTARDLSRVLPAMWQTVMRNRGDTTWEDYLASVRGDEGADTWFGQRFWALQDPANVLPRWEKRVPRERIHVVTVPPSGGDPAVLWRRFCSVLDIDPSPYSLKVRRANESLGTAESELLRRVNAGVVSEIRSATYGRWVKQFVARGVLERRDDQRRFALPQQEHAWLRPRADAVRAFLAEGTYDVVGDLDDLVPAPPKASAVAPDVVDTSEVLDAAVDVIAGLLGRIDRQGRNPGPPRGVAGPRLRRVRRAVGVRVRRHTDLLDRLPRRR